MKYITTLAELQKYNNNLFYSTNHNGSILYIEEVLLKTVSHVRFDETKKLIFNLNASRNNYGQFSPKEKQEEVLEQFPTYLLF